MGNRMCECEVDMTKEMHFNKMGHWIGPQGLFTPVDPPLAEGSQYEITVGPKAICMEQLFCLSLLSRYFWLPYHHHFFTP